MTALERIRSRAFTITVISATACSSSPTSPPLPRPPFKGYAHIHLSPLPGDAPTDCLQPDMTYADPAGNEVVNGSPPDFPARVHCDLDDKIFNLSMSFNAPGEEFRFLLVGGFGPDGMSSDDAAIEFTRLDYGDFYQGPCTVTFTEKSLDRMVGYVSCSSVDEPSRLSHCTVPGAQGAGALPKSFFRFENCVPIPK